MYRIGVMCFYFTMFEKLIANHVLSDDERITKQRQYSCALGCWPQQEARGLFCFSKGTGAVKSLD